MTRCFSDLVWSYPDPIPECPKIKGYLCFFNEQVDEIRVDGVPVARPVTPWSKDWKEKAATVPDSRGPVIAPLVTATTPTWARHCGAPRKQFSQHRPLVGDGKQGSSDSILTAKGPPMVDTEHGPHCPSERPRRQREVPPVHVYTRIAWSAASAGLPGLQWADHPLTPPQDIFHRQSGLLEHSFATDSAV